MRIQHATEVSQKLASTTSSAPVVSTLRSLIPTRQGRTTNVRPALENRELLSPQSCPLNPRARRLLRLPPPLSYVLINQARPRCDR